MQHLVLWTLPPESYLIPHSHPRLRRGSEGAPDPPPAAGLGVPGYRSFSILGSRTQRGLMAGGCSVRHSPFGRATGVSAGSQRRQEGWNSEGRGASLRRLRGDPLPEAKQGGPRTPQRPPNLTPPCHPPAPARNILQNKMRCNKAWAKKIRQTLQGSQQWNGKQCRQRAMSPELLGSAVGSRVSNEISALRAKELPTPLVP